jgi:hypothetical protein
MYPIVYGVWVRNPPKHGILPQAFTKSVVLKFDNPIMERNTDRLFLADTGGGDSKLIHIVLHRLRTNTSALYQLYWGVYQVATLLKGLKR